MSIQGVEVGKTCRMFGQISDLSSVVKCPSPSGTTAVFQPETNSVRWRPDGGTPAAGVGFLLIAGNTYVFNGDLSKLSFIQEAAGATLNISVFE